MNTGQRAFAGRSSDTYTIDVPAYHAWLASTGQPLNKRLPLDGEVVLWKASFRRTWEPLKPYDWLCQIEFKDGEVLELPFALLKRPR